MSNRNQLLKPENRTSTGLAGLTYYRECRGGYALKHTHNRLGVDKSIPFILVAISLFILLMPALRATYFNLGAGIGTVAFMTAFLLTETKRFHAGRLVSEYKWGLFRKAYPTARFTTYQLKHRKHNRVHMGTDVRLIFRFDKRTETVFLCQVDKAEHVDNLLTETSYVLNKMSW